MITMIGVDQIIGLRYIRGIGTSVFRKKSAWNFGGETGYDLS